MKSNVERNLIFQITLKRGLDQIGMVAEERKEREAERPFGYILQLQNIAWPLEMVMTRISEYPEASC